MPVTLKDFGLCRRRAAAGVAAVAAAGVATAFGHLLSRLAEFAFTVVCYVASFPYETTFVSLAKRMKLSLVQVVCQSAPNHHHFFWGLKHIHVFEVEA